MTCKAPKRRPPPKNKLEEAVYLLEQAMDGCYRRHEMTTAPYVASALAAVRDYLKKEVPNG